MQFPVPQFTEVEDKIIGPLTLKQFGIIFAAGIFIFLFYSATKSILVLVFVFMLIGLPALTLAFGKINGRAVYMALPVLMKFFTSPKVLIFHKELGKNFQENIKIKEVKMENQETVQDTDQTPQDPQARLLKLNRLLEEQASREKELARQIH